MKKYLIVLSYFVLVSLNANSATPIVSTVTKVAGLTATVSKEHPQALEKAPTALNRYLLQVDYGQLSQVQFDALKAKFHGLSQVPYSPTKKYSLVDFLPPVMQALVNRTYGISTLDTSSFGIDLSNTATPMWKGFDAGIYSSMNCIATAYETSRLLATKGLGTIDFYGGSRRIADAFLKRKNNIKQSEVKFGDLVVFSVEETENEGEIYDNVQHVAIFITDGIVFEKTDTDSNEPFRLSLLTDVQRRLNQVFAKTKRVKTTYNRPANRSETFKRLNSDWTKDFMEYSGSIKDLPSKLKSVPLLLEYVDNADGGGFTEEIAWVKTGTISIDPKTGLGVLNGEADFINALRPLR